MLDANAVILLLTGHKLVTDRAAECAVDDLCVSAIAFGEVARGSNSGKQPSMEVLDEASRKIPVLPFDQAAAKIYASLPFRRVSCDRLIAAHAIAAGLILVTADRGLYADIPGLNREDWTR